MSQFKSKTSSVFFSLWFIQIFKWLVNRVSWKISNNQRKAESERECGACCHCVLLMVYWAAITTHRKCIWTYITHARAESQATKTTTITMFWCACVCADNMRCVVQLKFEYCFMDATLEYSPPSTLFHIHIHLHRTNNNVQLSFVCARPKFKMKGNSTFHLIITLSWWNLNMFARVFFVSSSSCALFLLLFRIPYTKWAGVSLSTGITLTLCMG